MDRSQNPADTVIITHHQRVSELNLNRADKLNALNADLVDGLLQGIADAVARQSQLLVIRGAGRAFCAGFDLSGLNTMTDADLLLRFVRIETLLQAIYTAPMHTLALVQGRCVGAGADIIAACNQRVATADSSFRMPGLQFGIVLGARRLAALIGSDAARDILQTSRVFDAEYARSCGFLTDVCASDNWPALVTQAAVDAAAIADDSRIALLQQSRDDRYLDQDMAALVRSASHPGLAQRIAAYLSSLKQQ